MQRPAHLQKTTVAGRDSHPLKNGAFHGAPDNAFYVVFGHGLFFHVRAFCKTVESSGIIEGKRLT